jgi:uncharacterized protein YjdB
MEDKPVFRFFLFSNQRSLLMKKLMACMAIFVMLIMACSSPTGGGSGSVPVTEVTVTPSIVLHLGVGATIRLDAEVSPPNASDQTITWSSGNPDVATVDSAGNVTAVASVLEPVTIYARAANGVQGASAITVVASEPLTGVVVSPSSLTLIEGHTSQLIASVEPESVEDRTVTWSSSDDTVATVDSNGLVTAVAIGVGGPVTITAKSVLDNDSTKTGACTVTVSPDPGPGVTLVNSITLDKTSLSLSLPGGSYTLTPTVLPDNATDDTLTWTSTNELVATVNDGTVTAVGEGTAVITAAATDESGVTATCSVTVVIPVESVSLDEDTLDLTVNDEHTLTATITPPGATNKALIWKSNNSAVAEVDQNGKVTARAKGTATITVTTASGGYTDTCTVVVPNPLVRQKLDEGISYLVNGQYDQAISSFEAAFTADTSGSSTYVESVVYSSLGKLSSILKENSFRSLMANRLGVTGYPTTLDSLFTGDWFAEYAGEIDYYYPATDQSSYEWVEYGWFSEFTTAGWYLCDYSDWPLTYTFISADFNWPATQGMVNTAFAPGFNPPSWLTGPGSYYNNNLISMGGGKTLKSIVLLEYLFYANLLDKNTNGLNTLLDEVTNAVFGSTFTSVDSRINTLVYNAHATLDADVIAAFGLNELFEGDDIHIGKAELKVLISGLKLIKGSLEWLRAYDWNINLTYLRGDFGYEDAYMEDLFEELMGINPNHLPLRSSFLKERSGAQARMNQSKTDYLGAIGDLFDAWDYIDQSGDIPPAVHDILDNYQWIKGGLDELRAAINGGTTFYVPEELPGGNTWSTVSSGDAAFGVNFGKFFTPGQLGINNLIENNSNTPKFYRVSGGGSYTLITVSSPTTAKPFFEGIFDTEDDVAIKIQYSNFKDLLPGLFDDDLDDSEYFSLGPEIGALLYYRYNNWTFNLGD